MTILPTIIGLVGLTGTGKSTAARIVVNEFGFDLIRVGSFVHQEMKEMGLNETPENERKAQVAIRARYGMDALSRLALPQITEALQKNNRILLDSMCSFSEKDYLSSMLPRLEVVAFHAPLRKREAQLAKRSSRALTKDQMNQRDLLEIGQLEKGKLITLADYHIVNNEGLHELERSVRKLFFEIVAVHP
jgi:dephospho-CoA kinase